MPENHAQSDKNYSREYQIKCRGTQPSFEQLPLFPEKISDQDVSDGIGRRPREVVKQKSTPWYFRHTGQQVDQDGRKQKDEPRDKNGLGAMTFEKLFRPLHPLGYEMEPADFFQAAMAQPPSQPKGTSASQKTSRRSSQHRFPQ